MIDKGVYRKFEINRTDGRSGPGGKHYECRYFVLDLDHDPHVWAALRAYAKDCAESHPLLSADLEVTVDLREADGIEAALRFFDEQM